MSEWIDLISRLFDTSDWPPRWNCGKWTETHGWLYIVSDLLIWGAYFAIPLVILRYITKRYDLRFFKLYILFATFIFACGATHLLDAIMFWWPAYRLSALIKLFTGVVSWVTVFAIFHNLPRAFRLKSPEELEAEVEIRKKAEEKLALKNRQLNEAQTIARMGHWEWDVKSNKVDWSESLFEIYGIPAKETGLSYEEFLERVHPDDRDMTNRSIGTALSAKKFNDFFHRIVLPSGEIRTLHARGEIVCDASGSIVKVIGTGHDVTEEIRTKNDLLLKTEKLENINQELQRYAYVASHDLQEPLRKITTFVSMLREESSSISSESAMNYIGKIEAASVRMQKLIQDVLNFSSLSFRPERGTPEKVDLHQVVQNVLSDLEVTIMMNNVMINLSPLPSMTGDATQLGQLFQNLIGNAIKFRSRERTPVVNITFQILPHNQTSLAEFDKSGFNDEALQITIEDNGIGFDEKYKDLIFQMFQRLHTRSEYDGTGIGLALCKRIVEYHKGTISVSSEPGVGSRFIITFPKDHTHMNGSLPR